MKIFAAIVDAETVKMFYEKTGIKLNYLISYHYLKGQAYKLTTEYRPMIKSLYLDSGAYSASSGRSKITVSEYLRYLKFFGGRFDACFNLDDKFDVPEHNQWNQGYLEDGLGSGAKKPIPVVHNNADPIAEFDYYVILGHQFIAIGSTTKISDDILKKISDKHPNVRIHMFGNLNRKMLKEHKPYSADSATWAHAAGLGSIFFWDPDEEKEYMIYLGSKDKKKDDYIHYKKFQHKSKLEHFLYETFHYEYPDLMRRGSAEARQIINLYFFKQLEDYINNS